MSTLDLTVTRVIPAAPEAVFDAWLDPAALAQFIRPAPEMTAPTVETDPREGGSFLIVMKAGGQELPHRGEYRTIDRPRRLVFSWLSAYTSEDSTVTLTFEPEGEGQTKLTLHHVGFPHQESRDNHEGGWGRIIDCLAPVVS